MSTTLKNRNCLYCGKNISLIKRKKAKFCSQSCSATYYNLRRSKITEEILCITCNSPLSKGSSKYCSLLCQQTFFYKKRVENWFAGLYDPISAKKFIKRYLTETHGYKCTCCGISDWNGNPLILEIDHIDGKSDNNSPDNLRFICPNCHSQTNTYKSKNRGNGRHFRRERYKKGLSY